MLKTILVDDEPLALDNLELVLADHDCIEVVDRVTRPEALLESVARHRPQVIFLDIQMPNLNGIDLAETLQAEIDPPFVIFVTAHDEYALDAFKVHAFSYLMKPIDAEQVTEVIKRLVAFSRSLQKDLWSLTGRGQKTRDKILIRKGEEIKIIPIAEIGWVRGAGNYLEIQAGQKTYLLRKKMYALEDELGSGTFVRIHRSKMININHVTAIQRPFPNEIAVVMKDGSNHKISKSYFSQFKSMFIH